jgi:TRAP-type mannitol/chloroaromatic compound transport system permease small subunit
MKCLLIFAAVVSDAYALEMNASVKLDIWIALYAVRRVIVISVTRNFFYLRHVTRVMKIAVDLARE